MRSTVAATSPSQLRQHNAAEVLDYAWNTEAFTASGVIAHTGLTRSTAIGLCDELVDRGWLIELENQRAAGDYSMGRPARRYRLNAAAACIVGVDAGEHSTRVTVADLRGDELAHRVVAADHGAFGENPVTADARRSDIVAAVDATLEHAGLASARVLAIAIGVPAPVDARGASPQRHDFWARLNPQLVTAFDGRDLIVLVDNDANLAALAEGWRGAGAGVDNYITMLSGERLGSGIVVDGNLLRGRFGAAGEMEFLSQVEGVGGAHGIAWLARAWSADAGSAASATEVLRAADRGENPATGIRDRLADHFALIFTALTNLIDTEVIVVSGAVAESVGPLLEIVAERLPPHVTASPPRLEASTLGENVVVDGAVRKALTHVQAIALTLDVSAAPEAATG